MIDRNLQHCPFTNVTPIEKSVPVCAGLLNQLFDWFFNSKLCEKKENWTAVVQHWLLANQTGSLLTWLQGRFRCSLCPPAPAGWQMELLEGDLEISLSPAVWRDGTNSPCMYNTGRVGLGARSEPVRCRDPLGQRLHCLCPAAGAESEGKPHLEMAKSKSRLQQTTKY